MLPHQAQNISRNFTMKNLVIESSSKTVHLKKSFILKLSFLMEKKVGWIYILTKKSKKSKSSLY